MDHLKQCVQPGKPRAVITVLVEASEFALGNYTTSPSADGPLMGV